MRGFRVYGYVRKCNKYPSKQASIVVADCSSYQSNVRTVSSDVLFAGPVNDGVCIQCTKTKQKKLISLSKCCQIWSLHGVQGFFLFLIFLIFNF